VFSTLEERSVSHPRGGELLQLCDAVSDGIVSIARELREGGSADAVTNKSTQHLVSILEAEDLVWIFRAAQKKSNDETQKVPLS
jgi:hypothetical protein